MKNIKDYDLEDLKKELVSIGEKPFRAEQIFANTSVLTFSPFDNLAIVVVLTPIIARKSFFNISLSINNFHNFL